MIGFLNINKPLGMTSHDVVAKVRRGLNMRKIGHAGTLDPLATGVLIVCVDAATRLSDYVMQSVKRYEARVHLGIVTETYDAEGQIVAQQDASHIRREDVERVLAQFTGDIDQLPPMYSAIKQGGRKLYDIARAGETVDRAPRRVQIAALAITDWQPPQFTLAVTCSAGTYIRSLAYDIGAALEVGAYLAGLTRTASGSFRLEDAIPLDTLLEMPDWQQYLIAPQTALSAYRQMVVDAAAAEHLRHGRAIDRDPAEGEGIAFAFSQAGVLLAVLHPHADRWQPEKVFVQENLR
jgi:tRNA pseudouridine55 synthase